MAPPPWRPDALVTDGALTLCCADMDARPLFWTTDGGRDGFEPAAAAVVADRLGLEVTWRFERWDRFQRSLEAGSVDAIWCGVAITAERRRRFGFSRPYAAFDEAVLVRSDSPIASLGDLRGTRVGAIAGSTNMRLAETFGAGELVAFDGSSDDVFADMIEAVRGGRLDAMVDDEPAFGGATGGGEFRIVHVAETQNRWAAACRRDGPIADLISRGIGAAVADGGLAAEWRRWFPCKPVPAVIASDQARATR
jgi:polar amino acid transport system substrate-binding protein